jgi:hypothetical protein
VLAVVGLFAFLAVQFLQGSVLRGFTNGELVGADYWRDGTNDRAGRREVLFWALRSERRCQDTCGVGVRGVEHALALAV